MKDKTVLDLACGEGRFTRKIKQMHARHVIGVDISKEMIELAKKADRDTSSHTQYFVCDVTALGKIGAFDVVTAAFLFNYASSKETLLEMCRTVYDNLTEDGRLVASINATPLYSPLCTDITKKYGYLIECPVPLHEGDPVEYIFFTDKCSCRIRNYHWSKKTYEWALYTSGFKYISWQHPVVSKNGMEKYGSGFWTDFLKTPNFVCIECC